MNKYGFFTNLFMSLFGVIFIIISVLLFGFTIKIIMDYDNIKNNGVEIEAKIINKSIDRKDKNIYYDIEYTINGEKYTKKIKLTSKNYKTNDNIKVYYLENSLQKIFIPLENNIIQKQTIASIIASIVLAILGYESIKEFNIFKYKKIINIE